MDSSSNSIYWSASATDEEKLDALLDQCGLVSCKKKLLDDDITFKEIFTLFTENKNAELRSLLASAGLTSADIFALLAALAVISPSASGAATPSSVTGGLKTTDAGGGISKQPAYTSKQGTHRPKRTKQLTAGDTRARAAPARSRAAAALPRQSQQSATTSALKASEAALSTSSSTVDDLSKNVGQSGNLQAQSLALNSRDPTPSDRSKGKAGGGGRLLRRFTSMFRSQNVGSGVPLSRAEPGSGAAAALPRNSPVAGALAAPHAPVAAAAALADESENKGTDSDSSLASSDSQSEGDLRVLPPERAAGSRGQLKEAHMTRQGDSNANSGISDASDDVEAAKPAPAVGREGGSLQGLFGELGATEGMRGVGGAAPPSEFFSQTGGGGQYDSDEEDDLAAAIAASLRDGGGVPVGIAVPAPAARSFVQQGGERSSAARAMRRSSDRDKDEEAEEEPAAGSIGYAGVGAALGDEEAGSSNLRYSGVDDEEADLAAAIAASVNEGKSDSPPPQVEEDPLAFAHKMRFRSRRPAGASDYPPAAGAAPPPSGGSVQQSDYMADSEAPSSAPTPSAAAASGPAAATGPEGGDVYTDFSPLGQLGAPELDAPYTDSLQTMAVHAGETVPLATFLASDSWTASAGSRGGIRRLSSQSGASGAPLHPLMAEAKARMEHDIALRAAHARFFGPEDPPEAPLDTPWGGKQLSSSEPDTSSSTHDFGPEDAVHFSAYAPSAIAQGGVAPLDIWAFLKAQEAAVREAASAKGSTRRGDSLKSLGVRRGELITIDLRVPMGVFMLGEDGEEGGGSARRLTWVGYKPLSARWWVKARRGATVGAHAAHALVMVGVRVLRVDLTLTVVSSHGAASAAAFAAASMVRARQAQSEMGRTLPPHQRGMWLAAVRETGAQGRFVLPAFGDGSKPEMVQVDGGGSISSAGAMGVDGRTAPRGSSAFDTVTPQGPVECSWLKTRMSLVDASLVEISWEDIELGAPIGAGAHGTARSATIRGASAVLLGSLPEMSRALGGASSWSGISAVVKQPCLDPLSGNDDVVRAFKHEMAVTAFTGQHPNIVTQLGGCTNDGAPHLAMVLEHCGGGSLDSALNKGGKGGYSAPSAAAKLRWCRDVASGLANMHSAGVLHCDVACRNVLLADDGTAKVADMGLARYLGVAPAVQLDAYGPFQCMAPEMMQSPAVYSRAADVYAFGTFVYEVFASGERLARPWEGLAATDVMACLRESGGARLRLDASAHKCDAAVAELQRRCCSFAFSTSEAPLTPSSSVSRSIAGGLGDELWGGLQLPVGGVSEGARRCSTGGQAFHVAMQGTCDDEYVRPSMGTVVTALEATLSGMHRQTMEAAYGGASHK